MNIKSSKCSHTDCEEFELRTHSQGADEVTKYKWCKRCGALWCDNGGVKPAVWRHPALELPTKKELNAKV